MSDPVARLNAALEGRYAIERELGEGGMATVYLADDLKHERKVALKVLKPELAAVVGAERFLAEIKTTANLTHPHILPLHDSGEADSFLFYVMPHVQGESLRERIDREKQLAVQDSVAITQKVAGALDYAHGHGVVHRDIKPANILLSEQAEPLIADFGIALAVAQAGAGRITETGLSLGTPHYMSPEQATGDRDVDPRSDVYALGCVLYEMLAGQPPFSATTAQSVLVKILTTDAPSITNERRTVPANVGAALAKSLEKLPADRFKSAAEFATALGDESFSYQARSSPTGTGQPTEALAAPVSPFTGAARPWLRDRRSIATLLMGTVAAVAAVSLWVVRAPQSTPVSLSLSLDLGEIAVDQNGDLIISPDGSAFAFASDPTAAGGSLYLRREGEAQFRPVPGTDNARYPAFSPDGEWIVYRELSGAAQAAQDPLLKVSLDGGSPSTVLRGGVLTNPVFPHWGDDGTIVFRADEGLFRVSENGGEPEPLLEGAGWVLHPRLLPGGQGILVTNSGGATATSDPFARLSGDQWIGVLDLETDSVHTLIPEGVDPIYLETGHILFAHSGGGLWAVPFDLEALQVSGAAVPVLDEVDLRRGDRAHYSLSTTGTLVYGSGGVTSAAPNEQVLVVAELSGAADTLSLTPRMFGTPRWSPDGRSIAYYSGVPGNAHIYIYSVEMGTTPARFTSEGENRYPVWSPDGTQIVFSSNRDGTEERDLFVRTVNGSDPEERILTEVRSQDVRAWSVNDLLLFEGPQPVGGRSDLWIATAAADASATVYVRSESDLDDVAVSPDAAWAAYQSNQGLTDDVYVRSFPDAGREFIVSSGGGQFPRWSPDGGTIYYWRRVNASVDSLFAARVRTEPTFAVLSEDLVLTGDYVPEYWDIHPDGDRIVVAQPAAQSAVAVGGQERFTVVVNFFEELKERVPN